MTRPQSATGLRRSRTILVAGSDLSGRCNVAKLLAGQGYGVKQVATGDNALALIKRGGIDLLVAAVVLNDMDGLELLKALRHSSIDLPAMAISSGNEAIDRIYLKAATLFGAAKTYSQPLQTADFLDDARVLMNSFAR